jgi:hypothetical protein
MHLLQNILHNTVKLNCVYCRDAIVIHNGKFKMTIFMADFPRNLSSILIHFYIRHYNNLISFDHTIDFLILTK